MVDGDRFRTPGVATITGYRIAGGASGVHRGLPSSRLTFIVSRDDGVVADGSRPTPVLLGGLHTRAAAVELTPSQAGVQLAVHPLAARALFGASAADLNDPAFDGLSVLGAAGRRLYEQVCDAPTWDDAFDSVARFVAPDRVPGVRRELVDAWRLLERGLPVAAAASEVGLTTRHLETLFRREVGHPPRTIARLIRFERTTALIGRAVRLGRRGFLADAAAAAGYTDQAHLTREFGAFAGTAPGRWIAEEFANLQAGGHRGGESLLHEQSDPLPQPAGA